MASMSNYRNGSNVVQNSSDTGALDSRRFSTTVSVNRKRPSKWGTTQEFKEHTRQQGLPKSPTHTGGHEQDVRSDKADFEGGAWGQADAEQWQPTLQDWDGKFGPPPESWEQRPDYIDTGISERIKSWVDDMLWQDRPPTINLTTKTLDEYESITQLPKRMEYLTGNEIAPHSWAYETVEGLPLEDWWTRLCQEMQLDAQDAFWHRYDPQLRHILRDVNVPDARLDPTDNDPSKLMQTSESSHLAHSNRRLKRKEETRVSRRKEREALKEIAGRDADVTPPKHEHAPRINMYIRPADRLDVPQMLELYNSYITDATCTSELEPLDMKSMKTRWQDIENASLPMFVAVLKGHKGQQQNGHNNHYRTERILGMAFADDFNDKSGLFRYTVEIEVFVRSGYQKKGIGRCLLDKLLNCLDKTYPTRGGYDFVGEPNDYSYGGRRRILRIIAFLNCETRDTERQQRLQNWLSRFEFEKVAELPDVGFRNGQFFTQTIMIKKTGGSAPPA